MRQTTAANLALGLVALAWPMLIYGTLSQMADIAPDARGQVMAARHWPMLVLCAGMLSLFASIALAGYALPAAKVRSSIALAVAVIPLLVIVGMPVFR